MDHSVFYQVSTPSYIFDCDALKQRVRHIRSVLGEHIGLIYAMKANPFLIGSLAGEVDAFEVCSPGEERICERAGIPGVKLLLSGVNKERRDFDRIMERFGDQSIYTAESENQVYLLQSLAAEKNIRINVLLRLTNGSQFGMDEPILRRLIEERSAFPNLCFCGIHFFTGTQKKSRQIERELHRLDDLLCELKEKYKKAPEEKAGNTAQADPAFLSRFEYGPGLAVPYFLNENDGMDEESLFHLKKQLDGMCFDGAITIELGRYIAGWCGYYLTSVADMKENEGIRYAVMDGGIHQMVYYGQTMAMKIPHMIHLKGRDVSPAEDKGITQDTGNGSPAFGEEKAEDKETLTWTLVGSLCSLSDILVREYPVANLQIHDILVFERTGAYSMTEGISLFLSRDLPAVWLYEDGCLTQARKPFLTEELNYAAFD